MSSSSKVTANRGVVLSDLIGRPPLREEARALAYQPPATPDDDESDRRGAVEELETAAENLQHWAADWLPSLCIGPGHLPDVDDWLDWLV